MWLYYTNVALLFTDKAIIKASTGCSDTDVEPDHWVDNVYILYCQTDLCNQRYPSKEGSIDIKLDFKEDKDRQEEESKNTSDQQVTSAFDSLNKQSEQVQQITPATNPTIDPIVTPVGSSNPDETDDDSSNFSPDSTIIDPLKPKIKCVNKKVVVKACKYFGHLIVVYVYIVAVSLGLIFFFNILHSSNKIKR